MSTLSSGQFRSQTSSIRSPKFWIFDKSFKRAYVYTGSTKLNFKEDFGGDNPSC